MVHHKPFVDFFHSNFDIFMPAHNHKGIFDLLGRQTIVILKGTASRRRQINALKARGYFPRAFYYFWR
jgi:hypothetical protein